MEFKEFVIGKDEKEWITIINTTWKDVPDYEPLTLESMKELKYDPRNEKTERFFIVKDAKLAGCVRIFFPDEIGFISLLSVLPRWQGKGLGRALLREAMRRLSEKNIHEMRGWFLEGRTTCEKLFKSEGYEAQRKFCMMKSTIKDQLYRACSDIEIQDITLSNEDITWLTRLENECFKDHYGNHEVTEEEVRFFFEHKVGYEKMLQLFAKKNGNPVGFIEGGWKHSVSKTREGHLFELGVLKSARKQGIGTELLRKAIEWFRSEGVTEATLQVDENNANNALQLYEKEGFKTMSKNIVYVRKNET